MAYTLKDDHDIFIITILDQGWHFQGDEDSSRGLLGCGYHGLPKRWYPTTSLHGVITGRPRLPYRVTHRGFHWGKATGGQVNRSHPSSGEVKNAWHYSCTPPYFLSVS